MAIPKSKTIVRHPSFRMRDVFAKVEMGMTLTKACRELGLEPRVVRKKIDEFPEFKKGLGAALQVAADSYMERAQDAILGASEETRSGASLATALMKHYHKMAASFNRDLYGEAKTSGHVQLPMVTISFGLSTAARVAVDVTNSSREVFDMEELPVIPNAG